MIECPTCGGDGLADDPTACGDPEHCDPFTSCPRCKGIGEIDGAEYREELMAERAIDDARDERAS